jgi:hypothetical protein
MFEVTLINALIYTLCFSGLYYLGLCLYVRRVVPIEPKKLAFYITLFCLFGLAGELLVNNAWHLLFGVPLWEYKLFPFHNGDVSYFFIWIWGGLGYYRYLNDTAIHHFKPDEYLKPGLIMGAEAVLLELAYNGFFYLLFGGYIFYYLPADLGPFSHLSCLEVIPFYFAVGFFTSRILARQNMIGYSKRIFSLLAFYWMVIVAFITY